MLQKCPFHNFWQANTANQQTAPHNNVIKGMNARAACRPKGSELLEPCVCYNVKGRLWWGNNVKCTVYARRKGEMDRELYG
jgi:hypothetical protein